MISRLVGKSRFYSIPRPLEQGWNLEVRHTAVPQREPFGLYRTEATVITEVRLWLAGRQSTTGAALVRGLDLRHTGWSPGSCMHPTVLNAAI